MNIDERALQVLAQFLERDERVLATGLAETGPVGFHWDLLMTFTAGLARLFLVRNWRLAVTNRRIILFRRTARHPSAPWEEQSFPYGDLARAQIGSSVLYRVLRLRTVEGQRLRIRMPFPGNDFKALEEALRQAAPQLTSG